MTLALTHARASAMVALLLALPFAAEAGTISYDRPTNTWTVTGFDRTETGSEFDGAGWLAGAGGSNVGGSVSLGWFTASGHWIGATSDASSIYSDFYWDQTQTIEVSGVEWTNASDVYSADLGDGVFYFANNFGSIALNNAPAEGAILNGTFSFAAGSTLNAPVLEYTSAVPAPVPLPASLPLLIGGFGAVAALRMRSRRA